jgi:beta-lactam-binding protein with PASTA domain
MKIWKPVMQKYFQQIPRTGFNQPPRKIDVGRQVKVPSLRGLSVSAATRKLERQGFTVDKRYIYHDKVPKYGFIGWSPSPGSWISEFGMVYAVYSNGRDPAVVAEERLARERAQEEKAKKQQPSPSPTLPRILPPNR